MHRDALCAFVTARAEFLERAEWAVIGCAADHERAAARRFLQHPTFLALVDDASEQAAEASVRAAVEALADGGSSGDSDLEESSDDSSSASAASEVSHDGLDLDGLALDDLEDYSDL